MSIHVPSGTITKVQISNVNFTEVQLIEDLKSAMVTGGWSSSAVAPFLLIIFSSGTALPTNNQTAQIGATTYKFVTTLSGAANEVLIGATPSDCCTNLMYAINDTSAYEGTKYGTGTSANASVSAAKIETSYKLKLSSFTTGPSLNGNVNLYNWGWSNVTYASTKFTGGGYLLSPPSRTPQGYYGQIWIYGCGTDGGSCAYMDWVHLNGISLSGMDPTYGWPYSDKKLNSGNQTYEVVVCAYQVFVFKLGVASGDNNSLGFCLPYADEFYRPKKIDTIADNGGAVQVHYASHGLANGSGVYCDLATEDSGTYIPGLTGLFTISVDDADNFTLTGTTFPS